MGKDVRHYFAHGAKLLNGIRENILIKAEPDRTRELIGEYYHVMANARPYDQVNNSIFMAQANYLLRLTKHLGIPHHDLDHLFHRVNSEQARSLWGLALQGKQLKFYLDLSGKKLKNPEEEL